MVASQSSSPSSCARSGSWRCPTPSGRWRRARLSASGYPTAAGRLQGRRCHVRRQDGQGAGDADAAEAVPDRDDYVIVNGQVVVDGGKHTGMPAGRALRPFLDGDSQTGLAW